MYEISARLIDICLPDYLRASYSGPREQLACASLGATLEETADTLHDSLDYIDDFPEEITDDQIKAKFRDALAGVDLRYRDEQGNPCDDVPDDREGDEPLVYVVLTWQPAGE
jgi:hypothetical protein